MKQLLLISLFSFNIFAQGGFGQIFDKIFEEQEKMMDKLMDSDVFNSFGSFQGFNFSGVAIDIDSKIIKKDGKTYEVVSIKPKENNGSLKIEVDKFISVESRIEQTNKNQNTQFSSTSVSSQSFPIPRGGIYKPLMSKNLAGGGRELYFEVTDNKVAQNYNMNGGIGQGGQIDLNQIRQDMKNQLKGIHFQDLEDEEGAGEENKGVILPQKKI